MASRQGMIRTTIALGIAFTLGAPLTASAQAGGGAGRRPCTGRRRSHGRRAVAGAHSGGGGGGGRGGRRPTVHARGRRPGPPLGALQLGLASGHAAQRSGTRLDRLARISGEGHHASGWAALQRDEVPQQHQLPDVG